MPQEPAIETKTRAKRRPRFQRAPQEDRPAFKLTSRDRELLKHIYDHRFITAAMLQDLTPAVSLTPRQQEAITRLITARRAKVVVVGEQEHPLTSTKTKREIQRRLQALYHHGYVQRHKLFDHDPIIYGLGNRGADELTLHYGIDRQKVDWTTKNREVGERYIEHGLMVSRFQHALALALRQRPEATLAFWEPSGAFKVAVDYEDTYTDRDGGQRSYSVKGTVIPDGFFALMAGEKITHLFLEADRSTMTNSRYLGKLKNYFHYYATQVRTGQNPQGMKGFRVLTVTLSEARKENLRTIAREVDPQGRGLNLFWFACERDYRDNPHQLLASIWRTPADDTTRSILV